MVRQTNKPKTVSEAKQSLRIASNNIDYFGAIRRNPFKSTASAFVTGVLWGRLKKNAGLPPGLLEIALQLIKRM